MYHISIDWRRAKFAISHPSCTPHPDNVATVPNGISVFVPLNQISDVIQIRDWLHVRDVRCKLFGRYEKLTSYFRGIVFTFTSLADLLMFTTHWLREPQMVQ